jgi:hypothetical protein
VPTSATQGTIDPFAFFKPTLAVSANERKRLAGGEAFARALPAEDREIAIFAAVPVNADADRFIEWVREIAALKQSSYVLAIRRFSDSPRLEDLDGLSLDEEDLQGIRRCRPGDCALKLGADEMASLQRVAVDAGPLWRSRLQDAFRRVVLRRVQTYLEAGHPALPGLADGHATASLQEGFSSVLRHSLLITQQLPEFADYLGRYPRASLPQVESFLYWSKERLASKPTVSVTHVAILRADRESEVDVLVAGKQVFATHYLTGSLNLTVLVHGPGDASHYLAYLHRSQVDVLGGFFGGLTRSIVERRVKSESLKVLLGLRQRLESGSPPRRPSNRLVGCFKPARRAFRHPYTKEEYRHDQPRTQGTGSRGA